MDHERWALGLLKGFVVTGRLASDIYLNAVIEFWAASEFYKDSHEARSRLGLRIQLTLDRKKYWPNQLPMLWWHPLIADGPGSGMEPPEVMAADRLKTLLIARPSMEKAQEQARRCMTLQSPEPWNQAELRAANRELISVLVQVRRESESIYNPFLRK